MGYCARNGLLATAVAAVALFGLAGCQGAAVEVDAGVPVAQAEADGAPQVETAHTVTFPASYFTQEEQEGGVVELLESRGCTDVSDNGDGTFTATVEDEDVYEGIVAGAYEAAVAEIEGLVGESGHVAVESVDYDEQLAVVAVLLDADTLAAEDVLMGSGAGSLACIYQQVAGLPVGCTVYLLDSSGAELSSLTFPSELA